MTRRAVIAAAAALACWSHDAGRALAEPAPAQVPPVIDARTAHAKANAGDWVLVDIRTPAEWRETGLPASAFAVSLEEKPQAILTALDTFVGGDRTKPIALICATGGRSSYLAGRLRRIGFVNVINVGEGMLGNGAGQGWIKAGLPLRAGSDAANPPKLETPGAQAPSGGRP